MNQVPLRKDALELSPALARFVENVGTYLTHHGIPRIGGRMFGLFLVTTTPLSAAQIANTLKTSRGSVSTNVRILLTNGWIETVTFAGDRTEYYCFSPSAWEQVMRVRQQGFVPLKAMAEQALAALPAEHPAGKQLEDMVEWADTLIEHYDQLIAAWQTRRAEQRS